MSVGHIYNDGPIDGIPYKLHLILVNHVHPENTVSGPPAHLR
jgi:hypothetical protein